VGGGRITSEIAQVRLPSGEVIWVRLRKSEPVVADENATGAEDAGLGGRITAAAEVVRLPGFTETVQGVVASVRQAVDVHRPDSMTVEFGVEITMRTGAVLSVLAEGGGKAQVKVTATWDRRDAAGPGGAEKEAGQP